MGVPVRHENQRLTSTAHASMQRDSQWPLADLSSCCRGKRGGVRSIAAAPGVRQCPPELRHHRADGAGAVPAQTPLPFRFSLSLQPVAAAGEVGFRPLDRLLGQPSGRSEERALNQNSVPGDPEPSQ